MHRWLDELLPVVGGDGDPLGLEDFASHRVPLNEAPQAYEMFQKKTDSCLKVVLQP
ncbi:MAG: hypothetical protein ACT4PP_13185 [Sporichthyaceae bacterium]